MKRMICFGSNDDCMKFRTKKEFEAVFEVVMKMVEYCKNCMHEVEEMAKRAGREGI
jgi:uncharacterized protein YybS (DUF2232 family)